MVRGECLRTIGYLRHYPDSSLNAQVVDGQLFEARFNALRFKRGKRKEEAMHRPFARMHIHFILVRIVLDILVRLKMTGGSIFLAGAWRQVGWDGFCVPVQEQSSISGSVASAFGESVELRKHE